MTGTEPRALADAIRFLSIDAIERVGEGHPGTPLGAADTVTALFTRHLKFLAREPCGSTATASSCRTATVRCCSMPCCTSRAMRHRA